MTASDTMQPILLELDTDTWNDFRDRFAAWLGDLTMTQRGFRELAEKTVDKIEEPHIRKYLSDIAESARSHEARIDDLYALIDRKPSALRAIGGTLLGKVREGAADAVGALGGASGGWKDLRELLLANQDAMGAFAITEQLGLALGMPEVLDITFPIVNEKSTQQLLIQEYVLEMASTAILYHKPA